MSDKPTEDQPTQGERNRQAPETPSIGQTKEPAGNDPKKSDSEKASDREGQTREPGYDEA
ncbi:MAG: hypothetical protein ACLGJC_22835 [Alphaproteobacteria bacterium]